MPGLSSEQGQPTYLPPLPFGPSPCGHCRPLPPSQGFTYLFTVIDRFSRWTEAILMTDSIALTCATVLFIEWISKFGVPGEMTSDCGPHFTSELWDQLHHILGTKAYQTTSYYPQANGMVERFHHTMKASLMACLGNNPNSMEELPVVMLGLCTAFKEDLDCSSADLVYNTNLRLPGGFFKAPQAFCIFPSSQLPSITPSSNGKSSHSSSGSA